MNKILTWINNHKLVTGLITFFLILSISGSYTDYEDHIPQLHGKEITFNQKMSYIKVIEDDAWFDNERKKYDFILMTKSGLENSRIYDSYKEKALEIDSNMKFTVLRSYWDRSFGILNFDSGDFYFVVLKDENKITSTLQWATFISASGFTGYDIWQEF